ncbi:MAG: glycerophosphodiester phosphodiesterase [Dehalococcoidia bacterium]
MINIAHRGLSDKTPENTLYAFDSALEVGMNHLEFDVQLTSDNIPVVIHDETIDRTTGQKGHVKQMTFIEIKKLSALNGFDDLDEIDISLLRIPSFSALLDRYSDKAHLYIELKSFEPQLPLIIAEKLHECDALKYAEAPQDSAPGITIIAFSLEQVLRSKLILPQVRHGWLRYEFNKIDIELAQSYNLNGIYPFAGFVNKELVEYAKKLNIGVGVWGIEKKSEYAQLLNMGIHGATVNWLP